MTAILVTLWGFELWGTGVQHILTQTTPAYNTFSRIMRGLPNGNPIGKFLPEACLSPLEAILDITSQRYGIRILLSPNDHPCKPTVTKLIRSPATQRQTDGASDG